MWRRHAPSLNTEVPLLGRVTFGLQAITAGMGMRTYGWRAPGNCRRIRMVDGWPRTGCIDRAAGYSSKATGGSYLALKRNSVVVAYF